MSSLAANPWFLFSPYLIGFLPTPSSEDFGVLR